MSWCWPWLPPWPLPCPSSWPWPPCPCSWPWPLPCPASNSATNSASFSMSMLTKLHMSCARILQSSSIRTRLFMAPKILANLLISRMRSRTTMACSVLTKSNLFKMILSANAICWYASLTFPLSTLSSSLAMRCFASAREMTASSRKSSVSSGFVIKVRTIGTGSAMPVVSMMIWSIWCPALMSSIICFNPPTKSPRTVQHMHPFPITTNFSAMASLF
mmetsp:Transcript_3297/g.6880  ORF Transcript_3297/g.6880 Transcript_3297/m.6880 type:complete len:218 (-) Transcript_3297:67-720(-)